MSSKLFCSTFYLTLVLAVRRPNPWPTPTQPDHPSVVRHNEYQHSCLDEGWIGKSV